jgi:lysine 2,3-aminomutase
VPVVAPEWIDDATVSAMQQPLPLYLAVHVNHTDELTEQAAAALRRISQSGVVLLSQTVLLNGVNDSIAALETLFRKLVELKGRPYYLHHPDLAPGTSHFFSVARGRAGIDAELERPGIGIVSADLCPGYSRWLRQGAGGVFLYRAQKSGGARDS